MLEAIAYLGSGRSFRAQKTGEMVGFGKDFAEICGSLHSQERQQTLRWLLFAGARPRQLWCNGAKKNPIAFQHNNGDGILLPINPNHSAKK